MQNSKTLRLDDVVFREDLYPRIDHDPTIVQRYAADVDVLPPIEVNQNNELIDGRHRWLAHKTAGLEDIPITVTKTATEAEFLSLAIRRNATHGKQLTDGDKKKMAIRLYNSGEGLDKQAIADTLSVSQRMVTSYLTDIDKQLREERKQLMFDMWLACYTQQEIAEVCGVSQKEVSEDTEVLYDSEALPKGIKLASQHSDHDAPIFNVWTFAKKTNEVSHFGNSEQRILDNLLCLYTKPFDIVIDPFAGGGSTIDVCKKRVRRYWASDRKPIVAREKEIRSLDVAKEMPSLTGRWGDVALVYLDPPYWRQAKGQYSEDADDLANMELDQFTEALIGVVNRFAAKIQGGVIALLIQPTQWSSDDRQFSDHVTDIVASVKKNKKLCLENRVSCPYSTEQYNAQQVAWAKENGKLLVITRELIIWKRTN